MISEMKNEVHSIQIQIISVLVRSIYLGLNKYLLVSARRIILLHVIFLIVNLYYNIESVILSNSSIYSLLFQITLDGAGLKVER